MSPRISPPAIECGTSSSARSARSAEFWEQSGKWEAAAACYERSLEADPVAEGLYRRLMICLQEHGRRAEAIEVYHRCSKALSAALKIEPAAETNAVYEQLLKVPQ